MQEADDGVVQSDCSANRSGSGDERPQGAELREAQPLQGSISWDVKGPEAVEVFSVDLRCIAARIQSFCWRVFIGALKKQNRQSINNICIIIIALHACKPSELPLLFFLNTIFFFLG